MVVGSMAATRVTVNTPLAIKVGEGTTTIQSVLDSLAPGLIPLGITLLVWWMLKRNQYCMDHYRNLPGRYRRLLQRYSGLCRIEGERGQLW